MNKNWMDIFPHDLNKVLFDKYSLVLYRADKSSSNAEPDSLDLLFASKCGVNSLYISGDFTKDGFMNVLDRHIEEDENGIIENWLRDVDFGSFSKSDLYFKLISSLVLPYQTSMGFYVAGEYSKDGSEMTRVSFDNEELLINGIEHSYDETNGNISIECIFGMVPWADSFYFTKDDCVEYMNPKNHSLEDVCKMVRKDVFDLDVKRNFSQSDLIEHEEIKSFKLDSPEKLIKFYQYVGII